MIRLFFNWKYPVEIVLDSDNILKVKFLRNLENEIFRGNINFYKKNKTAQRLYRDLNKYFSGKKVDFSNYKVKLPSGFVADVLNEVRKIPYGVTLTYGEIAKKIGTSPRAVGQALKRNPSPIIIPCHRVIGKNSIGGFSWGIDVKLELLKLEVLQYSDF